MSAQTDLSAVPRAPLPAAAAAPPGPALDTRLRAARELVLRDDVRVLSLDVFDTVLFRCVREPVEAFLLLGRRLGERGLLSPGTGPRDFARMREVAESRARAVRHGRDGGLEVTLPEIYAQLPRWALRGAGSDALVEHELEVERGLLVPDLEVLELIAAAEEAGKLVVAVSDTYFREHELRSFLARRPASEVQPRRFFLSSAYGVGKATGLFPIVLRELGVRPAQVVHVGDNPGADLHPPERLGMRAVLYERRPAALEEVLEREEQPAGGDLGLTALRGRILRSVEREAQPPALRPFWDYGAAQLGPFLTGFAQWIHAQAAHHGAGRVHCLMREGHLLTELVNAAAPALGSPVDARPLWLSRQVCARAALRDATREELRALFDRVRLPTLRELCGTLGLDVEADLPALAARADARLDDAGLADEAIEAIALDEELRARIAGNAATLRRRIIRAVRADLEPDTRTVVLVDLGWGGTIQSLLQRVLDMEHEPLRTVGLYAVTAQRAEQRVFEDGLEMRGYLVSSGRPEWAANAIMRSPEVLEQICMPDHGSQVDLGEDLQPVLGPADGFLMQSVERGAAQAGALAFGRLWCRYEAATGGALPRLDGAHARRVLRRVLVRAVLSPTPDEAAVFAGWLHDDNFGSEDVESIVSGHAASAVRWLDPAGLAALPMTDVYWPFALAAIHDRHVARGMELVVRGDAHPDVFSAPLETGAPELYMDLGWGFTAQGMQRIAGARRSRHGGTLARATLKGDVIRRLRFDPADRPAIVRLDWVRLRLWLHDRPAPVTVRVHEDDGIGALEVQNAERVAPRVLLAKGEDPQVILDMARLAPGEQVWKAEVEIAFAVLGLTHGRPPSRALRRRLVHFAKTSPLGAPLRFARRVLLKLGR